MTSTTGHLFISYSRADREWLDRLRTNLKPLFADRFTSWDDQSIDVGAKWSGEISAALDGASAAVLLLSPDFLGSKFIMETEWPALKLAASERGLIIMALPIRPSAVQQTEIGQYQTVIDFARPVSLYPPAEQDAVLVSAAQTIHSRLANARRRPSGRLTGELPELRSFDAMPSITACACDEADRLWVTNGQQVKVFRLDQEQLLDRWVLRERRWKTFLDRVWSGGLVMADWEGAIYRATAEHHDFALQRARPDALPVHLLATGASGELGAAAWDGRVHRWSPDGSAAGEPFTVPSLPLHLEPLGGGEILVADQSNRVRLFDQGGAEVWSWHGDEPLLAVWADVRNGCRSVVAVARRRVIRIDLPDGAIQEQRLGAPVVSFSRRRADGDEWLVFAEEGGAVEWVSVVPLRIIRDSSVVLEWPLKQIVAVDAYGSAAHVPAAVGLTGDGHLVVVREQIVQRFDSVRPAERLMIAGGGRFLLLLSGRRIGLYRNPALPGTQCRMKVDNVAGTLGVGAARRLVVRAVNNSTIPIHHLRAELNANDSVDHATNDRTVALPVLPGHAAELEFSVRARVVGDVTLLLRLELADEGGPPGTIQEIPFYVESR